MQEALNISIFTVYSNRFLQTTDLNPHLALIFATHRKLTNNNIHEHRCHRASELKYLYTCRLNIGFDSFIAIDAFILHIRYCLELRHRIECFYFLFRSRNNIFIIIVIEYPRHCTIHYKYVLVYTYITHYIDQTNAACM